MCPPKSKKAVEPKEAVAVAVAAKDKAAKKKPASQAVETPIESQPLAEPTVAPAKKAKATKPSSQSQSSVESSSSSAAAPASAPASAPSSAPSSSQPSKKAAKSKNAKIDANSQASSNAIIPLPQVEAAVLAGRQHQKQVAEKQTKVNLFEDVQNPIVTLSISLRRIPVHADSSKQYFVQLPYPVADLNAMEFGLFVKDDEDDVTDRLEELGVTNVREVISVKRLSTEYRAFHNRKRLVNGYDRFLIDETIADQVPKLLGSDFMNRRTKIPHPINMADLAEEIKKRDRVVNFHLPNNGSILSGLIGTLAMEPSHLRANAEELLNHIVKALPDADLSYLGYAQLIVDNKVHFPIWTASEESLKKAAEWAKSGGKDVLPPTWQANYEDIVKEFVKSELLGEADDFDAFMKDIDDDSDNEEDEEDEDEEDVQEEEGNEEEAEQGEDEKEEAAPSASDAFKLKRKEQYERAADEALEHFRFLAKSAFRKEGHNPKEARDYFTSLSSMTKDERRQARKAKGDLFWEGKKIPKKDVEASETPSVESEGKKASQKSEKMAQGSQPSIAEKGGKRKAQSAPETEVSVEKKKSKKANKE